jgi:hypothetical protein
LDKNVNRIKRLTFEILYCKAKSKNEEEEIADLKENLPPQPDFEEYNLKKWMKGEPNSSHRMISRLVIKAVDFAVFTILIWMPIRISH